MSTHKIIMIAIIAISLAAITTVASASSKNASPADGFDIHIMAPHAMPDGSVAGPFHHYCKGIEGGKILQCLLFKSTDPEARLVEIEYFIAKDIVRENVSLYPWNRHYHDHAEEVATGRVQILDLPEAEAKALAEAAGKTDGILFHLWQDGDVVPTGEVTYPTAISHKFREK